LVASARKGTMVPTVPTVALYAIYMVLVRGVSRENALALQDLIGLARNVVTAHLATMGQPALINVPRAASMARVRVVLMEIVRVPRVGLVRNVMIVCPVIMGLPA